MFCVFHVFRVVGVLILDLSAREPPVYLVLLSRLLGQVVVLIHL